MCKNVFALSQTPLGVFSVLPDPVVGLMAPGTDAATVGSGGKMTPLPGSLPGGQTKGAGSGMAGMAAAIPIQNLVWRRHTNQK